MADKRISQLVDRGTVANNDVVPIVVSGAVTTNKATISSIQTFMQGNLDLGVTSVGITLGSSGTDVSVTGSPITTSGNITINIPTASATARGLVSTAAQTFAGAKTFNNSIIAGTDVQLVAAGSANPTILRNTSGTSSSTTGSNVIGFNGTNNIFVSTQSRGGFILGFNNSVSNREYTLPDASGTLALTSNLGAYLPLTGGTLTGALNGTSAVFSGGVTGATGLRATGGTDAGSQLSLFANGSGNTFIAGFDINFNTGSNNARTTCLTLASTGAAIFSGSVTATGGVIESGGLNIKGTGGIAKPDYLRLSNASAGAFFWDIWRDNTTGHLNFGAAVGGAVSNYVTFQSNGNVGIGTATPAHQLHIQLPSGINGQIIRMGRSAGSYTWGIGIDSTLSSFNFYNDGNVSVARINESTGIYTALSDERLKENIENSESAIGKLLDIKVRKYNWRDFDKIEEYGFVAQELFEVLPQYVQEGNEESNWGVAKAELVPFLIKAIQELKTEIDSLKNQIK